VDIGVSLRTGGSSITSSSNNAFRKSEPLFSSKSGALHQVPVVLNWYGIYTLGVLGLAPDVKTRKLSPDEDSNAAVQRQLVASQNDEGMKCRFQLPSNGLSGPVGT
jgi:hypothetical protein